MSQAWVKIADLPDGADVGAIAASPEGYGLVGIGVSGDGDDVSEALRRSRASILRATADGVVQTYEGAGWIVGLDGSGPVWFAVGATLQRGRGGSDYRLLRSLDGGRRWEDRGPVGARSVKSVLAIDDQVAWIHGATVLAATADGASRGAPSRRQESAIRPASAFGATAVRPFLRATGRSSCSPAGARRSRSTSCRVSRPGTSRTGASFSRPTPAR